MLKENSEDFNCGFLKSLGFTIEDSLREMVFLLNKMGQLVIDIL